MTAIPPHQSLVPVSVVRTHTTAALRPVRDPQATQTSPLPDVEQEQGRNRVRLWRDSRRPQTTAVSTAPTESPASRAAVRLTYGHAGQAQMTVASGQLIDLRV